MNSRSDATSWAFVLIAATSLALMITLYQIDWTIRSALNNYELPFSYDWAVPYWKFMQVGFALGWINIATAFAVQAYNIRMKRKAKQPTDAIENAWKLASSPETEKDTQKEAEEQEEADHAKQADEKPINDRESEEQANKEEQQRCELKFTTPEKLRKFDELNKYGQYSVEFIGIVIELLSIEEKTSFEGAFMFRKVLKALLEKDDIFSLVSSATHNGRL